MRLIATLAILALALGAGAQTIQRTERKLSLDECFTLALQHNYDVQIQRYAPDISRFNLAGSFGGYDPNFSQNATHSYNSSPGGVDSRGGIVSSQTASDTFSTDLNGKTSIGLTYDASLNIVSQDGTIVGNNSHYSSLAQVKLTQHLLKDFWIDSTRQTIEIAKGNLQISELQLRQQVMTTISAVQQAYYELIYSLENVKVQQQSLELAEKLLDENKKRVSVGALAPLDEKQSQSQVAARRADLLSAQRDLDSRQNDLKTLITDDFSAWQNVRISPSENLIAVAENLDLQQSWNRGLTLRPDLQQQKVTLQQKSVTLKYQQNQLYPAVDLFGSYGHNGLGGTFGKVADDLRQGENPRHTFGITFSMPLGNRAARNTYEAGKVDKVQSLLKLKKLEQDIVVGIDNAVGTVKSNYERVDATRAARLYAEAALEAEQKKLENGKSTSFFVLQLQRDLTSARTAEIRALADYNKSLAILAVDEGYILEKNKINLEIK